VARNGKSLKPSRNGHNGSPVDIDRMIQDGTVIDREARRAVRQAVLTHKKLGQPIVVWKNGRVVWLRPEEI